jgi:hypothetical protein
MATTPQQTTEFALRVCLSHEAGERLARRAAQSGRDVSSVASDLIEQAVTASPANGEHASASQRVVAWDSWVTGMRDWGTRHLPPRHQFQRLKATLSNLSSGVWGGALETKYFTSLVSTLRAMISQ